jgi:hypothetical protein
LIQRWFQCPPLSEMALPKTELAGAIPAWRAAFGCHPAPGASVQGFFHARHLIMTWMLVRLGQ